MPTESLTARLPARGEPSLSTDAILDRFIEWAAAQNLSLYPAQEEAVLELLGGKHVILATPTGSGKSLVAQAFHFMAMAQGKRSFYTCPIKALVNEKFFALCEAFGPENVGMMTGDAAINHEAPIICCTAEVLANLSLREQRLFAECVVMDEFHYYGDKERGVNWQVPLLTMPETQFLLMSATLGDMSQVSEKLTALTSREVVEVRNSQRPVPLEFTYSEEPLHETIKTLLQQNKAPIYLVNFTQRAAAEQAQNLLSIDVCTKDEKEKLKTALYDARFDTPFGKELKRLLLHGIGLHHAGLLPRYRRLVERLSQSGQLKVISGTDTLGVGVNIPIRTVLFTQLCKFDGEKTAILSVRDFQQIAGRAGRKGFDERGYVVAQAPAHVIENKKLAQKKAEGKKVVMAKPPEKGFVPWDQATFEKLTAQMPERLESRFTVTHAMLVNLLQAHREASVSGYKRLVELIFLSHTHQQGKVRLLKHARLLFRALLNAGIVAHVKRTPTMPAHLKVDEALQLDFSLNHTLSLFLVETLPALPVEDEAHPLNVLSLVESILESPDVVLFAQLDALKGEKIRELKAQGMEYDQRMEELEKLEHPKPNADFTYAHFNDFAKKHPWVGTENIRPKSIARDLFERACTFQEYVREYGLQRSEGVLLRYLSDAYKTLVQNVPEAARTEALEDIAAFLVTTLKTTDSSLIEEWQELRAPGSVTPASTVKRVVPPKDLATNTKALNARARAEMHRVVMLLARKNHEEIVEHQPNPEALTVAQLDAWLKPYWAERSTIDTTPRARRPELTQVTAESERVFTVRHSLLDENGEPDWYIEGRIDLTGITDAPRALIQVHHIGP